jgi:hypothetical protein
MKYDFKIILDEIHIAIKASLKTIGLLYFAVAILMIFIILLLTITAYQNNKFGSMVSIPAYVLIFLLVFVVLAIFTIGQWFYNTKLVE